MVSLALPTGSLEEPTLELFRAAGLAVRKSSPRAYRANIDYPGVERVVFYKPREIPLIVSDGTFDFGVTGADWIEETGAKVEVVHTFGYSKTTDTGWRVVLAVPADHPARSERDLGHGARIATEYPNIAQDHFERLGLHAEVIHSHGTTEAKIPELADAVMEVVETGSSLRQNNLRILGTVRRCGVNLVASPAAWADGPTRTVIEMLTSLLRAAHAGAAHLLLTVVVPADRWPEVESLMPARWWRLGGGGSEPRQAVVQGVFRKDRIAVAIAGLTRAGAVEIVETPIGKLASA
ncbi:ATP phosphoribosyltransferase [Streptomyces sp. NPDC050610]|uniref:ATP phosphoribosyltransferase n=1 Tax=Streptomyces sp. NPDC050610 TaxID=3157097 RepID=UPI003442B638